MNKKIEEIKRIATPIFEEYNILRAGVFGSVVRGEDGPESDVDILVELPYSGVSLWDVAGLERLLTEKLGKKVDLVQYKTIKPALKSYILPNEVRIYENQEKLKALLGRSS